MGYHISLNHQLLAKTPDYPTQVCPARQTFNSRDKFKVNGIRITWCRRIICDNWRRCNAELYRLHLFRKMALNPIFGMENAQYISSEYCH